MNLSFPFNYFIVLKQFILFPLLLRIRNEESNKKTKVQKTKEGRDIRLQQLIKKNKDVMDAAMEVLTCDKMSNSPALIVEAARLLDDIERGSLSSSTKHNSLLGRWYTKEKIEIKKNQEDNENPNLLIERDRIVTVNVKRIIIENEIEKAEVVKKLYRVLAVFTKSYNKWFMTEDKQMWSADMKPEDLEKYRCSVRMITDGSVEDYEDVDLNTSLFELKSVARIVTGLDIICVHNCMFVY